jgi:hypothetical protein
MKNLLFALTIASAVLLGAGCVSRNITEQTPPPTIAYANAPAPESSIAASPQMSPDVNFRTSNTMPGGPEL